MNPQPGEHPYLYDKSGNQTGWDDLKSGQKRVISWDEENRIQSISDNGKTSHFKYNDAGERVIKRTEQGETAYVNQFWTVRNRSIGTKHVFVGETRVSSKVVPGDAHVNAGGDQWAGMLGQWWLNRSVQGWKSGKNTVQNPHYAGNAMPDNLPEDNIVFFYHPDHLGSTEYVTDFEGDLYEHTQYFAFGETWVSEHKNTEKIPYLFTSKELDEETGLYYFGARYYDPRTSVWQSPDPVLARSLYGMGNAGVFIPINLALYSYSWNDPILLRDPDGRDPGEPWIIRSGKGLLGIGYGALQAAAPGGAAVDVVLGSPSGDADFLAGKGFGNVVVGVGEMIEGGSLIAAAAGVTGFTGGAALATGAPEVAVVAGGVVAAEGATDVIAGVASFSQAYAKSRTTSSTGGTMSRSARIAQKKVEKAAKRKGGQTKAAEKTGVREHRKGASRGTHDKHTKKRPGAPEKKDQPGPDVSSPKKGDAPGEKNAPQQ